MVKMVLYLVNPMMVMWLDYQVYGQFSHSSLAFLCLLQKHCIQSNAYILTGVYCCGWVRTGPTGVILSTLNEGRETAKVVVKDLNEGGLKDRKIIYSHQCLVSPKLT